MNQLTIDELFQIAIGLEKNGEKFYRQMAEKFDKPRMKDLFLYLADQEVKHKELFQLMVAQIEKYEPIENYPEEYFAYIRALADDLIFNSEKLDQEMSKISGISDAIDYAKDKESASLLYYQGIKNMFPREHHESIEKIIAEERKHYTELSQLKNLLK